LKRLLSRGCQNVTFICDIDNDKHNSLFIVAQSLTKGGGGGGQGAGFDGFISLLGGLGGGGAGSSDNILTVLVGLAKSFFAMQV